MAKTNWTSNSERFVWWISRLNGKGLHPRTLSIPELYFPTPRFQPIKIQSSLAILPIFLLFVRALCQPPHLFASGFVSELDPDYPTPRPFGHPGPFRFVLGPKLLKSYYDFGDFDYTIWVFGYIDAPGRFCVNTVIKAYSVSSAPGRALVVYLEWLRNGFVPNSYTIVPVFGSCAKMACVESGRTCHGQVVKHGVDSAACAELFDSYVF